MSMRHGHTASAACAACAASRGSMQRPHAFGRLSRHMQPPGRPRLAVPPSAARGIPALPRGPGRVQARGQTLHAAVRFNTRASASCGCGPPTSAAAPRTRSGGGRHPPPVTWAAFERMLAALNPTRLGPHPFPCEDRVRARLQLLACALAHSSPTACTAAVHARPPTTHPAGQRVRPAGARVWRGARGAAGAAARAAGESWTPGVAQGREGEWAGVGHRQAHLQCHCTRRLARQQGRASPLTSDTHTSKAQPCSAASAPPFARVPSDIRPPVAASTPCHGDPRPLHRMPGARAAAATRRGALR